MDPDLLTIEEMSDLYFRDKRARPARNAWADLPVCPCGFRVAHGEQCVKCKWTPPPETDP